MRIKRLFSPFSRDISIHDKFNTSFIFIHIRPEIEQQPTELEREWVVSISNFRSVLIFCLSESSQSAVVDRMCVLRSVARRGWHVLPAKSSTSTATTLCFVSHWKPENTFPFIRSGDQNLIWTWTWSFFAKKVTLKLLFCEIIDFLTRTVFLVRYF